MKTIKKIMKDIRKIELSEDASNLQEEIIIAFGDYEFKGVSEVIVSDCGYFFQCYVNHINAPVIAVEIRDNKIVAVM